MHINSGDTLSCKIKDSRNTSGLHRRQKTTDHGREGDARDDFGAGGGEGAEDTDLDAQRTEIGEATEAVGGDRECTWRERVVAVLDGLQIKVGSEFVSDEFRGEELGDAQNFAARDTHEEGHWVGNVANDKLKSKMVDSEASSDPCE